MTESAHSRIDDATCHQLIERLVAIKSVSGNERAASEFLVEQFRQLNYDASFVDAVNNAVGIRGSKEARTTIVLLGHIDTVPGEIPVRIEDGILYGRGSVDAKGPLAAFTLAAAQVDLPADVRLIVVGAVEEESASSKGARHFAREFTADYCVIGEPSGATGITLGYKGRILIDYQIAVDMGHSAGPERAAPELAAEFWQKTLNFCTDFNAQRPKLFDQLLPSLRSINSSSDGMTSTARCKIGVRLPPEFNIHDFQSKLIEFAGDGNVETYGYEPAHRSDRSNLLCRSFAAAIREQGAKPTYKLKTGTADMNVVAPIWKCPILAYGPGDSSLDHTPHEHLHLQEFVEAVHFMTAALTRLVAQLQAAS